MTTQTFSITIIAKAIGVGIATAVVLSLIMVPAFKLGLSPMPTPLGLAFAQTLLGKVPLPVGLLFHLLYISFWSLVFILGFKRHTFLNAIGLALVLWLIVLFFFFPIVEWGVLGLNEGPALMVASLVIHLVFGLVLWSLTRWIFTSHAKVRTS